MASFKQYTASGGASEAFSIPSFTSDEIKVRVDGVLKTAGTHYNITSYTVNGGTVTWTSGNVPSSGTVYIYRDTKILNSGNSDVEGKATYNNSSPIYHGDLNNNQKQVLRAIEEENDQLIQSWDLANGIVETDSIKDGTIVNADVNDNAAIAQLFDRARKNAWNEIKGDDLVLDLSATQLGKKLERKKKTTKTSELTPIYRIYK